MEPLLANGLNVPLVLGAGIGILAPVIAFQVFVEAFLLRQWVRQPYGDLCRLTFSTNCWSMAAGIPVKVLNAFIYSAILPVDIPGFFEAYPGAVTLGISIYFLATIGVEGLVASNWLGKEGHVLSARALWKGMFVANIATYAVLAPLYYHLTRPTTEVPELTRNANWTSHPGVPIVFIDSASKHLKVVRLGQSEPETIVPYEVRDYLVSENLSLCLFRGADNHLHFLNRRTGERKKVWETEERFLMNQVAFSPSGKYVAWVNLTDYVLNVRDVASGRIRKPPLPGGMSQLAWTTNEAVFYLEGGSWVASIGPNFEIETSYPSAEKYELLTCYGRVGGGVSYGGGEWGAHYGRDECGRLRVSVHPGLGSAIIVSTTNTPQQRVFGFAVNPGILHLSVFPFQDASFLLGCREMAFETRGHLYLLDLETPRIGTICKGEDFILLTEKYKKRL